MEKLASSLGYLNKIYENLSLVDDEQLESLYHDIKSAGVIIPSGEGRSKGALSIACSEMAKMKHGKIIMDRGDIGFPGREVGEAAPILKQRFGQVCLLINSGSGRSLSPLLDAQNLAVYIAKTGNNRDFRIDAVTSDLESPIGKLATRYGNALLLKGREAIEEPDEAREFRDVGVMEDTFVLASGILFHGISEALYDDALPRKAYEYALETCREAIEIAEHSIASEFYRFVVDKLEARHLCFFAGLGSSHEVARMTAVRVGHVKRAVGDQVFVARETSTPSPRAGDLLIVVSNSGETEIVAGWCKNFKRMGGAIAAVVGNPDSTIASLADVTLPIQTPREPGKPNRFYITAAITLSPLPIMLIERLERIGFKLPEYIIRWYQSLMG